MAISRDGDAGGTTRATPPTMSNANTKTITVGGIKLVVDKDARVLHLIDRNGRVVDVPKGSHFNGNKGTVDLPGGDHLTFSKGTITRNTPVPKTGSKLVGTTYYKNPYTGPAQKVDGLGQTSAPAPVKNGAVPGPVPREQAPGSAPLPPPSAAAPPVKKATAPPVKAPAKATPRPGETVKQFQTRMGLTPDGIVGPKTRAAGWTAPAPAAPAPAAPATGGRTSAPAAPAPVARTPVAPAAAPVAAPTAATPAPATPKNVDQMVRQMFGDVAAFLSDKELGPILRKAATEGWDNTRLQGAISQTKWWKNTADPARKWQIVNTLDHATAKAQVDAQSQAILDVTRAEGLTLNPLQIHDLAVNSLKNNWSQGQIRQNLFNQTGNAGLATSEQTKYGYLAAFADVPEVKTLLDRGAREGWDATRLQVELQKTNWWQSTTDAQRRFDALGKQSPADQKSAVTQQTTSVLNTAQALGVSLAPERAAQIAQDSLRFGWSPEQISKSVGAEFHYNPAAGGTAGKSASDLKALAAAYELPLSDASLAQWTEQIVRGTSDETAFENYLKEQAKTLRPWMAKAIDAGTTVAQYVDPLKQLAARELEVTPDAIDFSSPKYARLLDGVPDKDGQRRGMSLSEAQQYLRGLDDWKYTKAAHAQTADLTKSILETFGKVA